MDIIQIPIPSYTCIIIKHLSCVFLSSQTGIWTLNIVFLRSTHLGNPPFYFIFIFLTWPFLVSISLSQPNFSQACIKLASLPFNSTSQHLVLTSYPGISKIPYHSHYFILFLVTALAFTFFFKGERLLMKLCWKKALLKWGTVEETTKKVKEMIQKQSTQMDGF